MHSNSRFKSNNRDKKRVMALREDESFTFSSLLRNFVFVPLSKAWLFPVCCINNFDKFSVEPLEGIKYMIKQDVVPGLTFVFVKKTIYHTIVEPPLKG